VDEKRRKYRTVVASLIVLPKGADIFAEGATRVELQDEGAGPFVAISQERDEPPGGRHEIRIDPDEWPQVRDAIEKIMVQCREVSGDGR
jgi:hypothetical protein